ncbi:hypothetical protein HDG37_000218 [Paraburkholderia sp. MM5384-R2]|nr:hypothetical protein [Paraburkholderia sp. MM5384-R2]
MTVRHPTRTMCMEILSFNIVSIPTDFLRRTDQTEPIRLASSESVIADDQRALQSVDAVHIGKPREHSTSPQRRRNYGTPLLASYRRLST